MTPKPALIRPIVRNVHGLRFFQVRVDAKGRFVEHKPQATRGVNAFASKKRKTYTPNQRERNTRTVIIMPGCPLPAHALLAENWADASPEGFEKGQYRTSVRQVKRLQNGKTLPGAGLFVKSEEARGMDRLFEFLKVKGRANRHLPKRLRSQLADWEMRSTRAMSWRSPQTPTARAVALAIHPNKRRELILMSAQGRRTDTTPSPEMEQKINAARRAFYEQGARRGIIASDVNRFNLIHTPEGVLTNIDAGSWVNLKYAKRVKEFLDERKSTQRSAKTRRKP